ncbi:AMP-binding protein [uncultured Roseobacter sp.]|uniref:AMP-binding protein n=1 Tax=uncultured Roseobacter sp. TaxID=114847 RepID=UPI0026245ACC|nr:AMP-binding protein [uncultured Roseobacter sp.]
MVDHVLSRIRDHIAKTPASPALIGAAGITRFGELGERCAGIAAYLQGLPEGPLLVVGHKDHDCVAAMLACSFVGRPFVFVDQSNPTKRIERIAAIAGGKLALVASSNIALSTIDCVDLHTIESLPIQGIPTDPVSDAKLFYIVFTSGSTGEPKGVAVTRSNYAMFDSWYGPLRHEHAERGAHVNHASLAFDMGMLDLWSTLAIGEPVILLDHRNNVFTRKNMQLLSKSCMTSPASWFSTPSLLQIMCTDRKFCTGSFPQLKCFFVGGELVQKSLIRDLWCRFPEADIFHAYGPTEVTCVTHAKRLKPADLDVDDPLPLGPALAPNTMHILKSDGSLAAVNEPGELVLSGPQVAKGYLPSDHPHNVSFCLFQGEPSYRTGDLGHIDPSGHLVLQGRIDRQVKWNGNRIELDEIERVACLLPGVLQASCVPIKKNDRVSNIILFLQVSEGHGITRDKAMLDMRQMLPQTMVPPDIRLMTTLPLTINGKIDTKALRAIAEPETAQSSGTAPARTKISMPLNTPLAGPFEPALARDVSKEGIPT